MRDASRCYDRRGGSWSGRWESNPRPKLGKLLYFHCTTPARFFSSSIIYSQSTVRTDRPFFMFSNYILERKILQDGT